MLIDRICSLVTVLEDVFWTYGGIPLLMITGLYFAYKSCFFQIRKLGAVLKLFKKFALEKSDGHERGVKPIHAFFASIGGCFGIGNVIGVCTAIQVGGPGAVFWMWVAAILSMLIKYSEIYLGVKFRILDKQNSYFGGPMIYLGKVPGGRILAPLFAVLMGLYGIEIYQFRVMTESISCGWGIDRNIVIAILLLLIILSGQRGVRFVGKVGSYIIPGFLIVYSLMGGWVLAMNASRIPETLKLIVTHAFSPHAALGAFAGSTVLLSISYGVRRACYTGDIGVGYASTIHAESKEAVPARQASLGIVDILLDNFGVCTTSVMLILITGVWSQPISENFMVATALSEYFPYVKEIWPFFIFLLGYSTLTAFFTAGRRAAMFLSPRWGTKIYTAFSLMSFITFSYIGTMSHCMSVMSITGMMLLMINLYGLYCLRDEIVFDLDEQKSKA